MNPNAGRILSHFATAIVLLFCGVFAFAGPNRTTYQAKIIKPDGYPLEATNVNFKFTILDPAGACILYSETYSAVNMASTGGLISFSLGSGVKTYPTSSPTFADVFSNITPSLSCDVGGPVSYSPSSNDIRKIVMQFHDGSGWQTLPAMNINAVPYAMYADDSQKLGGVSATAFVQDTEFPTCITGEALHYNGTQFTCVTSAGTVSAAAVVSALGYTPADGASVTSVTTYAANVSATVFSVSSTVSSLANSVSTLQSSTAASFAAITSSQWVTSGTTISYNSGNVIVSGALKISMDSAACVANLAGSIRYNAGLVEYCNGTSWSAFGVAGAGITLMNGSSSGTQTFVTGISGTNFGITTTNGVHTFNIPLAASGSVTAGLLSNADYVTFSNKVSATSSSVISALGYTPASATSVATLASDLAAVSSAVTTNTANINSVSSTVAGLSSTVSGITSSQWVTSGSAIHYASGFVGIGVASATSRLTVANTTPDTPVINEGANSISLFGAGHAYFQGRDVTNGVEYVMGTSTLAGEVFAGSMSSHNFSLRTGNTKRMMITSSGAIGIGLVSPTAKLHIANGTSSTPLLKLSPTTLTTSPQSGSIEYDGTGFYITDSTDTRRVIATTPAAGTYDNATNITAPGNISLTPVGSVIVSSTTASTDSQTGALVVKGGLGVAGNIYSSGTIVTSSVIQGASVTATSGVTTPIIYGGTNAAGNLRLESTTHSSKGNIILAQGSGNIGMGQATPLAKLYVDGDGLSPNSPMAGTVAAFDNESADMGITLFTGSSRKASLHYGVTGQASRGAVSYQFNPISYLDKMQFDVNTQTRMVITGSGTIGLGTSAPTAMVNIANNTDQDLLTLKAHPSQNSMFLRITDSSGTTRASISPNGGMTQFSLGATNRINLTAEYGGVYEVPAGTAITTTSNLSLMNNGNPGIKTMAGYWNGSYYHSAWEIANPAAGMGSLLLMKSGGSVGIGVSTPNARLHLGSGTTTMAALKFASGTLTSSPQSGTIEFDGVDFYITDGTSTRRTIAAVSSGSLSNISTINSTGNITLVPTGSVVVSSSLVVNSGASVTGNVTVAGSLSASSGITVGSSANLGTLVHLKSTGGSSDIIYIDRSDTSPNLDIYSSYSGLSDIQSGTFAYGSRPSDDKWMIWERGYNATWANLFTITKDGKVGINTQSPGYPLDVFAVSGVTPVIALRNGTYANSSNSFSSWISGKDNANVETWWVGEGEGGAKRVSLYSNIAGYDVQMANPSGNVYLKNDGFAGVNTTNPLSRFHVNDGEIDISNLNVLKNRYGFHFDQAADGNFYYHRLGRVSFNDGDLHIKGSISGHDALSQGKAVVDIFINARNTPYANGAVYGDLMGSNLEVYEDVAGNLDVYLTTNMYSQINLDIAAAGNGNTYAVNESKTTSAPTGTLVYSLKRDSKFNVKNSGYVGIGVSSPSTRLHVGDYLENAHMESNTKFLLSGIDSYIQAQGDDSNGSFATGLILTNVPTSGTPNKHWGISHRTPVRNNSLTFGYGTSVASSTLLSATTDLMTLTTTGSIGLGVSTPIANDASATIVHIHSATGRAAGIKLSTTVTGAGAADGIFFGKWTDGQYGDGPILWNYEYTPITFATSGITRVTISASGAVGIGTPGPAYPLDVNGNIRISGVAYRDDGVATWSLTSDARLKDVVSNYDRGLKEILGIDTVIFKYKKDNPRNLNTTKEFPGVVAQQVQKVIPEAVDKEKDGFLSLNTTPIIWAMLNAIKEVYHKVEAILINDSEQDREIASLKKQNAELKAYLCEKDPAAPICK